MSVHMSFLTRPRTASVLEMALEVLAVVVVLAWLGLVGFIAVNADIGLTLAFALLTLLTAVGVGLDFYLAE